MTGDGAGSRVAAEIGVARTLASEALAKLEHELKNVLAASATMTGDTHRACGELRRAVHRSLTALQVVADELVVIEIVERYLTSPPSPRGEPS